MSRAREGGRWGSGGNDTISAAILGTYLNDTKQANYDGKRRKKKVKISGINCNSDIQEKRKKKEKMRRQEKGKKG